MIKLWWSGCMMVEDFKRKVSQMLSGTLSKPTHYPQQFCNLMTALLGALLLTGLTTDSHEHLNQLQPIHYWK